VGRYNLIRKLATGGMAEVILAKITGTGGFEKPVAVKRMLPSMAQDPAFVELFLREARLTVSLAHKNIVQVFDLGTVKGQYYLVLEFVDGENLRALLNNFADAKIKIGVGEAVYLVQQVAEGLAYAHSRKGPDNKPLNIIHRDINPANVMVSKDGDVKLADFGIAKAADGTMNTQAGVIKGKSSYLSPEQVLGTEVDQRSDLFLMGLMLWELLTGQRLFDAPNYFLALQRIASFKVEKLERLPDVPDGLWKVMTAVLQQDPNKRMGKASELADALQGFLFEARLRVGQREIAEMFTNAFPGRISPLQAAADAAPGELILLDDESRYSTTSSTPPPVAPNPARPPPLPTRPKTGGNVSASSPITGGNPAVTRPGTSGSPSARPSSASSPVVQGLILPAPAPVPPPPPPSSSSSSSSAPISSSSQAVTSSSSSSSSSSDASSSSQARPGSSQAIAAANQRPSTISSPAVSSNAALHASKPPSVNSRPASGGTPARRRRLGEVLVAQGRLTEEQLIKALERHNRYGKRSRLGEFLTNEGLISQIDLVRALSDQLAIPYISDEKLKEMPVPWELVRQLPMEKAERLFVVPIAMRARALYCAMREPQDLSALDAVKFAVGVGEVKGIFATESGIRAAIRRFYKGDTRDWSGNNTNSSSTLENDEPTSPEKILNLHEQFFDEETLRRRSQEPSSAPPPATSSSSSGSNARPATAPTAIPDLNALGRITVGSITPTGGLPMSRTGGIDIGRNGTMNLPAAMLAPPPVVLSTASPQILAAVGSVKRVMVVSDQLSQLEPASRLLATGGIACVSVTPSESERTLSSENVDLVLVAEDAVVDAPALVSRLAALTSAEVRSVVLSAALLGDSGPTLRVLKLVNAALEAYHNLAYSDGQPSPQVPAAAKLARKLAAKMGAGNSEQERAAACVYAFAAACRMERRSPTSKPTSGGLKQVLGNDASELADALNLRIDDRPIAPRVRTSSAAAAATLRFYEQTGTLTPTPMLASKAGEVLKNLSPALGPAIEALVALLAEISPAEASESVVLAEFDQGLATKLQARLMAAGVQVVLAQSGAEAQSLLEKGARVLLASNRLSDTDGPSLVGQLRKTGPKGLTIYLIANERDSDAVSIGLNAGADDVLVRPLNAETVAAKIKRALITH
jgi:serine/threonine-protein kinase